MAAISQFRKDRIALSVNPVMVIFRVFLDSGNENSVYRVINDLTRLGARLFASEC